MENNLLLFLLHVSAMLGQHIKQDDLIAYKIFLLLSLSPITITTRKILKVKYMLFAPRKLFAVGYNL